MRFKALAVDIDGTITDGRRRIQTVGIDALRAAEANGCPVILATGNVLPVAHGLASFLGLSGPVVAENGGVVEYQGQMHLLGDGEESRRAYEHIRNSLEVERLFPDRWRVSEVALLPTVDPYEVESRLSGFDVRVVASGFAIHLMPSGHSKMNGLRKAAQLLGVSTDEILAIGDSDNDASMLAGCGMGVAVGNASIKAKKAAGMTVSGKYSEGVREALLHFELI